MGPFQLFHRAYVGRILDFDGPAEGVDTALQTVHVTLSVTKTYLCLTWMSDAHSTCEMTMGRLAQLVRASC